MKRIWSWFWKSLLQALGFLLPIGLTIWVFMWLFGHVRNFLKTLNVLVVWFPQKSEIGEFGLSVGSFALMLFLVLMVGVVIQGILGRWLHSFLDGVMDALPGVNVVYKAIKQLLGFLFREEKRGAGDVVIVRAFHDKAYSMGFIMGESQKIDPNGEKWLKVFVPGVPNISSGFLMLVKDEDVVRLHTSIDQASTFLVSLGVLKDMRRRK